MRRLGYLLQGAVWFWVCSYSFLNLLYLRYFYPPLRPVDGMDHYYLWAGWALLIISLAFAAGFFYMAKRKR